MAKKKIKIVDKWKRKKWFTIVAPLAFKNMPLGEVPTADPDSLIGRTVTANLMTLTGDIKRQNMKITFVIDKTRGDEAQTHIKQFEILPSAVRRKIKRGRDRIDHSFVCMTKDNQKVRIKPILSTRDLTSAPRRAALRNEMVKNVTALLKGLYYETFLNDVISFKFQRVLKTVLHKIAPLRSADVRVVELLPSDAPIHNVSPEELALAAKEAAEAAAPVEEEEAPQKPRRKKLAPDEEIDESTGSGK